MDKPNGAFSCAKSGRPISRGVFRSFFSSSTTGTPQGVRRSHNFTLHNATACRQGPGSWFSSYLLADSRVWLPMHAYRHSAELRGEINFHRTAETRARSPDPTLLRALVPRPGGPDRSNRWRSPHDCFMPASRGIRLTNRRAGVSSAGRKPCTAQCTALTAASRFEWCEYASKPPQKTCYPSRDSQVSRETS